MGDRARLKLPVQWGSSSSTRRPRVLPIRVAVHQHPGVPTRCETPRGALSGSGGPPAPERRHDVTPPHPRSAPRTMEEATEPARCERTLITNRKTWLRGHPLRRQLPALAPLRQRVRLPLQPPSHPHGRLPVPATSAPRWPILSCNLGRAAGLSRVTPPRCDAVLSISMAPRRPEAPD